MTNAENPQPFLKGAATVIMSPLGGHPKLFSPGPFELRKLLNQNGIQTAVLDLNRFFYKRTLSDFAVRFPNAEWNTQRLDLRGLFWRDDFFESAPAQSLRQAINKELGSKIHLQEQFVLDLQSNLRQTKAASDFLNSPFGAPLLEEFEEQILKMDVVQRAPSFCFSASFPSQVFWSIYLAKVISKRSPAAKFYFGGASWTMFQKTAEGAGLLTNLAEVGLKIESDIQGLLTTSRISRLRKSRSAKIKTSDAFPKALKHSTLTFQLEDGCKYGKCTFCYFPQIKHLARKKTAEASPRELLHLIHKFKPRSLFFSDAFLSARQLTALLERLPPGTNVKASCFTRFEKAYSEIETPSKLYNMGLRDVFVGLESASPRILKLMDKGIDLAVASQNIKAFSNAGINLNLSLMVGFPTEEAFEVDATFKFIEEHRPWLPVRPHAFLFSLDPGTPISNNLSAYSIREVLPPESVFYPVRRVRTSVGMSLEESRLAIVRLNSKLDLLYRPQVVSSLTSLGSDVEIIGDGRLA